MKLIDTSKVDALLKESFVPGAAMGGGAGMPMPPGMPPGMPPEAMGGGMPMGIPPEMAAGGMPPGIPPEMLAAPSPAGGTPSVPAGAVIVNAEDLRKLIKGEEAPEEGGPTAESTELPEVKDRLAMLEQQFQELMTILPQLLGMPATGAPQPGMEPPGQPPQLEIPTAGLPPQARSTMNLIQQMQQP